jgi:hypothetical protein
MPRYEITQQENAHVEFYESVEKEDIEEMEDEED